MSNKKNTKSQSKFLSVVKEWAWAIAIALLGVAIIIFVAVSSCAGSTDIKPSPYAQSTTPEAGDFTPAADGQQTELPAEGEEIAVLETSKGVIKLRLFPEQTPLAYENFTGLIKEGYYDGITFHRVMNEFMIQGGDPEGTGRGGESIWGEDFAIESGRNLYNIRGALCMANTGEPNSNSSQFYIVQRKPDGTTAADLIAQGWPEWAANIYETSGGAAWLDKEYGQAEYTVFGQVISGMEVVDAIAAVATDDNDKPLEDVIIVKAYMDTYTAAQ